MDTEKLSVEVHKEFAATVEEKFKRQEDENNRQNKRIENLEKDVSEIRNISLNIERMTGNIESLTKEISRQSGDITNLASKVEAIEKEPAEKWKKAAWIVISGIIGFALALVAAKIGAVV